jgi:uncharacterized delta-60 repeat protein
MNSQPAGTKLLNRGSLYRLRNTCAALIVTLLISSASFVFPARSRQQYYAGQKAPAVMTANVSALPAERAGDKPKVAINDGSTAGADTDQDAWSAGALPPGELDLSFGVDGTVATDLGSNSSDSALGVAVQPDGKVVSVGVTSNGATGQDFAVTRLNPDGTLDGAFSGDGTLVFNFNSGARADIARAVAIQPDGKIIVAGEADVSGFGNFDIVLARLNPDGTFDTSFGNGGRVVTGLPNNRADFGRALALQTDGRVVVAGYSNRPTSGDDFVVARYNADGSLDTAFDGDGIVTTDILTNREDRASSVALQPGGGIVVAGYTNDPSFRNDFALVRYNANGSLDFSLNGTGKVTTDLNVGVDDIGNALALHGDGRIVVAGQSASDFGLVRYNADGSRDVSFGGGDGIVTTNFGAGVTDIGRGVVVQSNGKTTVAGRSRTELAFARYNLDGTPDSSFDADGLMVQNAGNNFISAFGGYWGMALQPDGKIVAVGEGWREASGIDFTVSRLNADGTFDLSFKGGDGIATTDIFGLFDEARAVSIQPDGKIVAAGSAQNATGGSDFAVVRYQADGTLDTSFGGDGIVTTDIRGNRNERAHALAIQPDGKIVVAGQTNNAADGNLDDGVLIRYNPNGTPDAAFGAGGIVITPGSVVNPNSFTWLRSHSIALQPDGKIVVAGQAAFFSVSRDGFVARYNPNGTLDSTFGTIPPNGTQGGTIRIDFKTSDTLNAVALQADGKVVVAGSADTGTSAPSTDFALARLTANGQLDLSFDGDGKVITNFENNDADSADEVFIQPDGKIIAAGTTRVNGEDFAAARYHPDGSRDASFGGGDGLVNIDFAGSTDQCGALALQPNGKIILGGVFHAFPFIGGYGAVKLNADGTLDASFGGGDGKTTTSFGDSVVSAIDPAAFDMAIQADGAIVIAGRANYNSTGGDFNVVRYVNEQSANPSSTVQFSSATHSVSESARKVLITATRAGNTSDAVSVNFATSDGTADRRKDYTQTLGTLHFAPGVTTQTVTVFITNDVSPEPSEAFTVTLSNPVGATLGATSTATVSINSDDAAPGPNPVDAASFSPEFFVRQHYVDFLNREADAGGLAFWTSNFTQCGGDSQCLDARRENVSAAFFLSIEFQETGFLVHRLYKAAYGDAVGQATQGGVLIQIPVPVVRLEEFLPDTQEISKDVIVGAAGWPERLDANKTAFTRGFVSRPRFTAAFPAGMTPEQFVGALNANAGNVLSADERAALINELAADNTAAGRASVLRKVAEDADLASAERNRAFVLMQFFGYLRRNPNDSPDTNYGGYNFWLRKLNDNNGNFVQAQMVKAFIDSIEYKQRFGQ